MTDLLYQNDALFSEHAMTRLKQGCMRDDETSPQERFRFVADSFGSNPDHADRIYKYASNLWLSFSTPILAYGKNKKSLPVSCFLVAVADTAASLLNKSTEARVLTMLGGGIGIGFGIRPRDQKSAGVFPHVKTYDADTIAWKQGQTRRGAYAAYLDISHPEVEEFIALRDPFGGDVNRKALNMHHGINITDDFMHRVEQLSTNENLSKADIEELDRWVLSHPASKTELTVSVKQLWQSIIETRIATGEPYLHFIDRSNEHLPSFQKQLGIKCLMSNLCAEIAQGNNDATGQPRTAVCCLSSLNLAKWDEWKDDPLFVPDVVEFLDNVLQKFIDDGSLIPEIADAVYSAKRERSIGIGALGWHDLLQSKNIPFESAMAVGLNNRVFEHIHTQAKQATFALAEQRGPCEDWLDAHDRMAEQNVDNLGEHDYKQWLANNPKVRNTNLMAIAPNASSSIILGTSPSIEPYRANIYREEGNQGTFMRKNVHLQKLLASKDMDNQETWSDIIAHDGSVQHIKELSEWERDVFKTAMEIDQKWVIQHAADRQQYICQSQSLNLFFLPNASIEYVAYLHLLAWKMGVKTLYYMRSDTISKAAKLGKAVEREKLEQLRGLVSSDEPICIACE